MQTPDLSLSRSDFGKLVMILADDTVHEGVTPVRAFSISAADEGLSLMSTDGRELAWITQPDALPTSTRALIEAELGAREFTPEIHTIVGVSTYVMPSARGVQTDRGWTDLVLRGEEDIRRLTDTTLLIPDSHDTHYLICNLSASDEHSRKTLDRSL